jgi:membrane protein required for colicin V production
VSAADWVILAVLVVSVAQAASEGFFHEAFGIAGLVIGYIVAAWQYEHVASWFAPHLKSPWLGNVAAFLLIFIGIMLLAGIAGRIARWLMHAAGLTFFDRMLGGLLGLLRGILVIAVVLVALAAFAPTSEWLADSQLAPYFLVLGRAAVWVAPSDLRARFYEGLNILQRPEQPLQIRVTESGK